MTKWLILLSLVSFNSLADSRPSSYTELLDYVQEAPDQGETATCLFMASTGAMELIANKVHGIKNPQPFGRFDLSESFLIWAGNSGVPNKSFFEEPVLRFNKSSGVHHKDWPYEAWSQYLINKTVWSIHPNFSKLPRMALPKIETQKLFQFGNRWSTNVLNKSHVELIKEELWKNKSPILVNINDTDYWHVILIVGYDDSLEGECYDTPVQECNKDVGSFYIRDSFGVPIEVRDYDWFRVKGNAAFVVRPVTNSL